MSSCQGQGSSAAVPAPAARDSRARKTKRSRAAVPPPSPPLNQRRSSFRGSPGGISAEQMGAFLATEIHRGPQQQQQQQHVAPFPGVPHAASGPFPAAASKDASAAPTSAGKQGIKRRNAKEIVELVEHRRAALKVCSSTFRYLPIGDRGNRSGYRCCLQHPRATPACFRSPCR